MKELRILSFRRWLLLLRHLILRKLVREELGSDAFGAI